VGATRTPWKAIFFDAVGTLIYLPKSVGFHYALVGRGVGLNLDAGALDQAFAHAWKQMPVRPATREPRENDDKDWWRKLVGHIFENVAPKASELDRDAFFEAAYAHFAEAGVWELYPEVPDVLATLRPHYRLGVISNFDGRLRMILEQLGISKFFTALAISSEVGADKPDPFIFQRAVKLCGVTLSEALHVGDDPEHDWEGAELAGLAIYKLERPRNSLREVVVACAST